MKNIYTDSFLNEIKSNYAYILDNLLSKAKKGWICPHCGNGSKGKSNDGIVPDPSHPNHLKCFSCSEFGDVFHWTMLSQNCNFVDAVKICADICGLSSDNHKITYNKRLPPKPQQQISTPKVDLTKFFDEAQKHLEDTNYWKMRGLSLVTCRHFRVGFIENWKHPNILAREAADPNFKAPFTPRLIIPTSPFSYLARLTRKPSDREKSYIKMKFGNVHTFNINALSKDICFLAEGEIDAMSIYEVGQNEGIDCAALGSKSYDKLFIKSATALTSLPKIIVICPDNDKDELTTKEVDRCISFLKSELDKLGVFTYVANVSSNFKDANEALINNREEFTKAVKKAKSDALLAFEKANQKGVDELQEDLISSKELAEILNVNIRTIQRWINNGKIKPDSKDIQGRFWFNKNIIETLNNGWDKNGDENNSQNVENVAGGNSEERIIDENLNENDFYEKTFKKGKKLNSEENTLQSDLKDSEGANVAGSNSQVQPATQKNGVKFSFVGLKEGDVAGSNSEEHPATSKIENSPEIFVPTSIFNCSFIKSVINQSKMPDQKIIQAAFSCLSFAVKGDKIIKSLLKKWLKDSYTDEIAQDFIDNCADSPASCKFIRNELGFSKCPNKDEICSEMVSEKDSPADWLSDDKLIAVAKLRQIKNSYDENNIIDMLSKENCTIANKVKDFGFDREFDSFVQKYKRLTGYKPKEIISKIDKLSGKQDILKVGDKVGDLTTQGIISDCPIDLILPAEFHFNTNGVWTKDNKLACCDPVVPINFINNIDSQIERYELAIRNPKTGDWNKHITTDANTLADARTIIKLANEGLTTNSVAAKNLVQFFSGVISKNKTFLPELVECDQPGWRNDFSEFVTPYTSNYYLGKGNGSISSILCQRGSFKDWLSFANDARDQSPAARICLAASFAAPLLKILGFRTFIIYFYGTSLFGKSAACKFGASVWGDPSQMISSFKATDNGLEAAAVRSNDLILIIDERQVANKFKDLKAMIYSLADGKTKPRMMVDKNTLKERPPKFWDLIILANGENNIVDLNTTQGVHSRTIQYHLEDDERIFPNEFYAQQVHLNCSKFCGTAGEIFINKLLACKNDNFTFIRNLFDDCLKKLMAYNDTFLGEHIKYTALLMTADILAELWIFNTDQQDLIKIASNAAKKVVAPLLSKLPSRNDLSDANRAWRFLIQWISSNRQHFFGGISYDDNSISHTPNCDTYGEIVADDYVAILPDILKKALDDAGYPAVKVIKDFKHRKWFELDPNGQYPRMRINGLGRNRMIKISFKNLTDEITGTKN